MRQNLRGESGTDTFCTLRKQDRELHGKFHRLLVTAVIRGHPVGDLRIEHDLLGEFAQSCLDVTRRRIGVTCEYVTPVTLAVNQIVSLADPYKGSEDGLVAVRVELHRLSDDVGNLCVAAVIYTPHGVEYTSLHRLESVYEVWYSSVEDGVGCIVDVPVLEHAGQFVLPAVLAEKFVKLARSAFYRVFIVRFLLDAKILFRDVDVVKTHFYLTCF